jgi:hypothetical protein
VLQFSGLASGECRVISNVAECGRGSVVVGVYELFHVSDRSRVGGIWWGVGRVIGFLFFQVWTPKSGTHYYTPEDGHTSARNMLSQ